MANPKPNRKQEAYNFFISKGLQPHQAAGIVGNLIQESGLNPNAVGDDGKAYGIAQWHPDRQNVLNTLSTRNKVDKSDFNQQLEFVWHELNTGHLGVLEKLKTTQNVSQATMLISNSYEIPNPKYAHNEKRIAYANDVLNSYNGNQSRYKDNNSPKPSWSWKLKNNNVNISNLNSNIIGYLNTLEPEYQDLILATAGSDGKHSKNSRHWSGNAIDLRIHNQDNPFDDKLWKRIEKDPNRIKFGLTLIDPNHGTAPHIHLSYGEGSENNLDVWKNHGLSYDPNSINSYRNNISGENVNLQFNDRRYNDFLNSIGFEGNPNEFINLMSNLTYQKDNEEKVKEQELLENEYKANIQEKIDQRNFLTELINSSDVEFVERNVGSIYEQPTQSQEQGYFQQGGQKQRGKYLANFKENQDDLKNEIKTNREWLVDWYKNRIIPNTHSGNVMLELNRNELVRDSKTIPEPIYNNRMSSLSDENIEGTLAGNYDFFRDKLTLNSGFDNKELGRIFLHEGIHRVETYNDEYFDFHDNPFIKKITPPYEDVKKFNPTIKKEQYDYISDPREIKSIIQEIRKEFDLDPRKEVPKSKVREIIEKSKKGEGNIFNQPIRDLESIFGKDLETNVFDLLNNITYNTNGNQEIFYGQDGGWKTYLNPKNWGVDDFSKEKDFDSAYKKARQQGLKEFLFKGERYNTNYKGTPQQQLRETGITNNQLHDRGKFEKRLGENLSPVSYNNMPNRVYKGSILNEKDPRRQEIEDILSLESDHEEKSILQKRMDAYNLYVGLPQEYNTFSVSKYRPSKEKNKNSQYYSLNNEDFENYILNNIQYSSVMKGLGKEYLRYRNEKYSDVDDKNFVMGNYTTAFNKDDRGDYISYYDKWDLFPIDFGKPFEIYDRIYLKDYGDGNLKKMYYTEEELKNLSSSKKNFDTLALQRELSNRGYSLPKSRQKDGRFDGILGDETITALKEWQEKNKK